MILRRLSSLLAGSALTAAALLAAPDSSAAGWASNVTVTAVTTDTGGAAYFKTGVTLDTTNGTPSCAASGGGVMGQAGSTNRMSLAFDASTPQGKNLLSLVTSAYLSGKPITVLGTGACMATSAGQIEVLSAFRVH